MSAAGQRAWLTGTRRTSTRTGVVWPTLVAAAWLAMLLVTVLAASHWNPYALVQFDRQFAHVLPIPHGAPEYSGGFDGQIYWLQATDPLLLHQSTINELAATFPGYHLQRVAYPALAWLVAGGDNALLPWSMLAVNVIAILGITQIFAIYARNRGWNPAWALAVGMMPGLLMPVLRDLSDVMAMACMFGAMLAWQRGRAWSAGVLIAVAALSREPMELAVAAVAIDIAARCWQARRDRGRIAAILRHGWPAVVIPVVAFLGWQAYIHTLNAPLAAAAEAPILPPFNDFLITARSVIRQGDVGRDIWVLAYFALTLIGMALSLANLRYGLSAPIVLAPLMALTLPVIEFGDYWSVMRYPAPMFLALLLTGLERSSRATLAVCGALVGMTVLLPVLL